MALTRTGFTKEFADAAFSVVQNFLNIDVFAFKKKFFGNNFNFLYLVLSKT